MLLLLLLLWQRSRVAAARVPVRDRALWSRPNACTATRRPLAAQLAAVVAASEELRAPRYTPTWWAAHPWANLALFVAKESLGRLLGANVSLRRENVATPDGGTISIDYCHGAATRTLPDDAPIVLLLPTLLGHVGAGGARCGRRTG